jgi:hypothetical protein
MSTPMTFWKTGPLCAAMLLLPASPLQADDLKPEVVVRCMHDMGEWGTEMIKRCVEGDLAAAEALQAYPEEHRRIVGRCTKRMQRRGWEMVKLCADKDIAAEDALARYPAEHRAVIVVCLEEVGGRGADRVKACVDRRIGAGASPDSD